MSVTHNGHEVAARLRSRAHTVPRELRNENVAIAKDLTEVSQAILFTEVYGPPADRPRSGDLLAADRWVANGMSVEHRNAMPYFRFRHRYGKPGGRAARAPKRASYWVRDAWRQQMNQTRARRRGAIRRGWRAAR